MLEREGAQGKKAEDYRALVHELTKERPDQKKLQILMVNLGLEYSEDSVERLNTVFAALNSKTQH